MMAHKTIYFYFNNNVEHIDAIQTFYILIQSMNSYNNLSSVIFEFLKGEKNFAPAVIGVVAGLWGAACPVNQIGLSSAPPISRKPGL